MNVPKDKEAFDRFIAVKANINSNTYSAQENIFEVDPDLAEQLLDVIREFDNPVDVFGIRLRLQQVKGYLVQQPREGQVIRMKLAIRHLPSSY